MSALDAIDARILRELRRDGRMPNAVLASAPGSRPRPPLRRVQDLQRRGVIRGFRAVVDPEATGRAYVVYVAWGSATTPRARSSPSSG
jgi:DNA-binding Lrp family transcriptional regulator